MANHKKTCFFHIKPSQWWKQSVWEMIGPWRMVTDLSSDAPLDPDFQHVHAVSEWVRQSVPPLQLNDECPAATVPTWMIPVTSCLPGLPRSHLQILWLDSCWLIVCYAGTPILPNINVWHFLTPIQKILKLFKVAILPVYNLFQFCAINDFAWITKHFSTPLPCIPLNWKRCFYTPRVYFPFQGEKLIPGWCRWLFEHVLIPVFGVLTGARLVFLPWGQVFWRWLNHELPAWLEMIRCVCRCLREC